MDEFGEKLLEELDYVQEGRNLVDFYENFKDDPIVKIPKFYPEYSGKKVLVMEWIDGVRCTNSKEICDTLDVDEFIRVGVVSGLRQLLEFGLFHGDPHPGNIFAMRDGRIAYVDFGNVAQLTQRNKEVLIDAVVHAVNEEHGMAAISSTWDSERRNERTLFVPALERTGRRSNGVVGKVQLSNRPRLLNEQYVNTRFEFRTVFLVIARC